MTTLLAISTAAALALLVVSVSESRGAPVSLSATYYELGGEGWIFQALLALVSLSLLPVWIGESSEGHEHLAFLSCASLLFVASAPAFRLELEGKVHYISAAVCCICASWWQIAEGMWDTLLFFGFLFGMVAMGWKRQWCWWLECAVILSVYVNLIRVTF